MPRIKLKVVRAIIWIWVLIIGSACAQERGTVIRKTPIKGMGGYEVITREAQEPEKIVYQIEGLRLQELSNDETQPPSSKPQEAPVESPPASEEPALQGLRRPRIPLRRNRNLLLNQQSELNDQD